MLKNLFELVYPPLCFGCDSLLVRNEEILCASCKHGLPYTYHWTLPRNETFLKFYGLIPLESALSLLYFNKNGIVQNLIHHLKYKGNQEVGAYLACLFSEELQEIIKEHQFSEIIPVPLHQKRLEERGYNQVETFCKALSATFQLPYNNAVLLRKMYSETQTHKDKEARQFSKNTFEVQFSEDDCGKHFLLVDDVITTGATLEKCAKALLSIPNSKVSILTMAYTLS